MNNTFVPLVCVECITFNHSAYVRETLEGFSKQETSFPFVCTIIDDASTDHEQDIINGFLSDFFDFSVGGASYRRETDDYQFVFAQHKNNVHCYFAVYLLKYNHYSIGKSKQLYIEEWLNKAKYLAFCEGDDYWVDPLKLQKQVDFLERNEDYGLVHTNSYTNTEGKITRNFKKTREQNYEEILLNTEISTLTVLMRSNIYIDYLKEIKPWDRGWFVIGDAPIWKYAAYRSKVILLEDITSVYRFHASSISHSGNFENKTKIIRTAHDIKCYFNKYYSPKERFEYLQKLIDKSYFQSYLEVCAYFGKSNKAVAFLRECKKDISKMDMLYLSLFYIIERLKVFYHNIFG